MKLREIKIHNYRAVIDLCIEAHDYTLLVGASNAGKSTVLNALQTKADAGDRVSEGGAKTDVDTGLGFACHGIAAR